MWIDDVEAIIGGINETGRVDFYCPFICTFIESQVNQGF